MRAPRKRPRVQRVRSRPTASAPAPAAAARRAGTSPAGRRRRARSLGGARRGRRAAAAGSSHRSCAAARARTARRSRRRPTLLAPGAMPASTCRCGADVAARRGQPQRRDVAVDRGRHRASRVAIAAQSSAVAVGHQVEDVADVLHRRGDVVQRRTPRRPRRACSSASSSSSRSAATVIRSLASRRLGGLERGQGAPAQLRVSLRTSPGVRAGSSVVVTRDAQDRSRSSGSRAAHSSR